jgi:hypothetical protein
MAKTIAAYGGGFKPPTKGHLEVVKRALKTNPDIDEFIIYVGGKERDGIGQTESLLIWDIFKKYLPMKVKIEPSTSPIGDIVRLGKNNPDDKIYFVIGGREGRQDDLDDIANRTKNIEQTYPNMEVKVQVTPNEGMSGTNARKAAKVSSDKLSPFLPDELTDEEKEEVFNIIRPIVKEDYFGLNQFAREVAKGVLNEGKYDSLVTKLAGFTLNAWKGDFEDGQPKGYFELEVGPGKEFDYPHLMFKYIAKASFVDYFKSGGVARPKMKMPEVELMYFIPSDELPRMWEQIAGNIRNVIRHEIEHLMQSGPNVKKGKEMGDDSSEREELKTGKKPWWKIWRKALGTPDYYKLEKEIDANLQGLYLKAKKTKQPLEKIIDIYLQYDLNLPIEDREDIKALWKKRAPKLNIPLEEGRKPKKDPKKGTGKKPEGSSRRLYTDEDPKDTVGVKFRTKEDIVDTLNKKSFKSRSHARQSQVINLIHQRVRAAYGKAKDPETKARLKRGLDYIEKRKEASKKKTQRLKNQKNENIAPNHDGKAAPFGSGYDKVKERKGFGGRSRYRAIEKRGDKYYYIQDNPFSPGIRQEFGPYKTKEQAKKKMNSFPPSNNYRDIDEGDTYEKMAAKGKKAGSLKQGTVRKRLNIPKDKKIPLSLINKEIARLKKMDKDPDKKGAQLGDKNQKYYKALQLAKTLKTTTNVNENATYSKKIDLILYLSKLTQHMLDKGMNIEPLPTLELVDGDTENASDFFGKTAYYDPNTQTIVLYTEGRHPKDIARSYAHEMVHHTQFLEDRLGNITTTNTTEDDELDQIEREAYLNGNMTFRNWTDSLNEAIVGDKIECDGCGWSWNIVDGGDDLFICHKCGHDNTPLNEAKPYKHKYGFDDKLGKDPFGLNQFAREIAEGVLNEGRYDKFVNQISKIVFEAFKDIHDRGDKKGEFEFSIGPDDEDIFSDQFEFDLAGVVEITDDEYVVDGGANAGFDNKGEEITPLLSVKFKIPKNPNWQEISFDIKDVVRHELEHLTQDGLNVVPGKQMGDDELLRQMIDMDLLPKADYFKLAKEVDAMLQGLYFKAKKSKQPFGDVINDYLDKVGLDDSEKESVLKIWRNRRKALSLPLFENELDMDYKIFSDMDGVITDFNNRYKKYAGMMPAEYEKKFGKDKFWELADAEGVAFWVGMPWMEDGKTYWDYIKKYDVELLSSPSRSETSRLGKRLWVRNNLPGIKLTLAQAANKQNYAAPNHILIDDRESNIEQWRDKGGIGILHTSAADTIRQLKDLGL